MRWSGLGDLLLFEPAVASELGVIFLETKLVGRLLLIFGGGVEEAGAFFGHQADEIAHGLYLFTASAEAGDDLVDTEFVDNTLTSSAYSDLDPTVFARNPIAFDLHIGEPSAAGLDVGVGDPIPALGPLAGDLTDFGHRTLPCEEAGHDWRGEELW